MAILSLIRGSEAPPQCLLACHWSNVGAEDVTEAMGAAALGCGGDLSFVLTEAPVANALCAAEVTRPNGPALLRLDEVAFPEGAIAYRHIHPGPGIRTLVAGELRLISDHETQVMRAGDSWFEDANAPVRAENTLAGNSRFVRAMILPVALQGKPSIQILAAEDKAQPRLQVTHRHIDHIFTI